MSTTTMADSNTSLQVDEMHSMMGLFVAEYKKATAEQQKATAEQQKANAEQQKANAEQQKANAETKETLAFVVSELSLLKQGIIIIGGKAVSDLYGISEQTKNEWQSEAQAFSDATSPEAMTEFVNECHANPQFRKQAVIISDIVKSWHPTAKKSEVSTFGKFVSMNWYKMFGVRPAFQLETRVMQRKQSACYYPPSSRSLLDAMAGFFFGERTDLFGDTPKRMY